MKKCTIIGKFAFGYNIMDGQTVKCKTIYDELVKEYGQDEISYIDTYKWKKSIIKTLFSAISSLKNSENVIMLPAHNGVKVFGPLLDIFNKKNKTKLHYIVIGSWLLDKVNKSVFLRKNLKKFTAIYVETTKLREELILLGFKNVYKMNNYKNINILNKKDIKKFENKKILNVCTFSRINYEKGIEDAINILNKINRKKILINLDIYGQVEEKFKEKFDELLKDNSFAKYEGVIDSKDSVNIIKNYDLLLFPTRYKTEGIPGTIIDAYASGVPVLASKWDNYIDVVDENITGFLFNFNDLEDFENKLIYIYDNQKNIYEIKNNCLNKAKEFCNKEVLDILFEKIESD